MMLIRLYRVVPFLIVLAIIAFILYLVVGLRYSRPRAKEVILKLFTWLSIAVSVVFALASAYALFEQNEAVFDLMITFCLTGVVCLIITQICYAVFLKHYPDYRHKRVRAHKVGRIEGFFDDLKKKRGR